MATKSKNSKKSTNTRKSESNGLYTAGMVLGIIGVVFAFVPLMYWLAYILGVLALVFGIIGLVKKDSGHSMALTSTILGAVALVVGVVMNIVTVQTVNNLVNDWGTSTIDALDDFMNAYESDIVGKYADVTFDGWQEVDNEWSDHAFLVTVTNISDETRSYSFSIEAVDENGDRLDDSSFYVEALKPGESKQFATFTLTTLSDEVMNGATYRIFQSTSY